MTSVPESCPEPNEILELLEGARELSTIDRHLASCSACRKLLAELFHPGVSAFEASPGATVGRFVLLQRIGEGAMGVVFAAYDPKLDRRVALKLLRAQLRGSEAELRLEQEGRALAKVAHPNVVTVHDVGSFSGHAYIAMERVDGQNLREWLGHEQRSTDSILAVFLQAGEGLAASHEAGVVHRDFKPENVLVGADGRVRVTDFGLANVVAATLPTTAPNEASIRLTQTGARVGTPAYMSPEQHAGAQATAASDQFSFGVTLYEALFERRPFRGETWEELAQQASQNEIQAASTPRRVPAALRKALLRALSADPTQRFASVAEMLTALRPKPRVSRAAAAITAALVGAVGALAFMYFRAPEYPELCRGGSARIARVWSPQTRDAVKRALSASSKPHAPQVAATVDSTLERYTADWEAAYTRACEATRVRGEQSEDLLDLRMGCLDNKLRSVEALTQLLATEDSAIVDNAVRAALALPSLSTCENITVLKQLFEPALSGAAAAKAEETRQQIARAAAMMELGKLAESFELAKSASQSAATLGHPALAAEASYQLGLAHERRGDPKSALPVYRAAFTEALRARHDEVAVKTALLAGLTSSTGEENLPAAEQWVGIAAAIAERVGDERLTAFVEGITAFLADASGQWQKSLELRQSSAERLRKLRGESDPDVATARAMAARSLLFLGRPSEALELLQRALPVLEQLYGKTHPRVNVVREDQASIYSRLGRFDEAEATFRQVLAFRESTGEHPLSLLPPLLNLSKGLIESNRCDEALTMSGRAEAIAKTNLGATASRYAGVAVVHCMALACSRRFDEAEVFCQRAAEIGSKHPEDSRLHFDALGAWGEVLVERGRAAQALRLFRQAEDLARRSPNDVWLRANVLGQLGRGLRAAHRNEQAVGVLEEALSLFKDEKNQAFVRVELAQALWATRRDRERAKQLGREAQEQLQRLSPRSRELVKLTQWLESHP